MANTFDATRNLVIVKNGPRDNVREARNGRIYTGTITTWDVVDADRCAIVAECLTRREARATLARLLR